MKTFNTNEYIYIKLTKTGICTLLNHCTNRHTFDILYPTTDGLTKIQLWQAMAIFGPHISIVGPLQFETEIGLHESLIEKIEGA